MYAFFKSLWPLFTKFFNGNINARNIVMKTILSMQIIKINGR